MVRPLTNEKSCHAVLHEASILSPPRMHQGSAGVADPYKRIAVFAIFDKFLSQLLRVFFSLCFEKTKPSFAKLSSV